MMKGFKQFLMRGNVIDLAVAVVIGAAFGSVVSSFVKDLLTPLISAAVGNPDFSGLYFTLNGSRFNYGNFINSLVAFLLVSAAIYYFVVVPTAALSKKLSSDGKLLTSDESGVNLNMRECPECLSSIPIRARRCSFCCSQVSHIERIAS